jgi:hypothetical protein
LFGAVCLLAAPGAAATVAAILTVLDAPGLRAMSWTLFTGLASPPFTLGAWILFLFAGRKMSRLQAAAAFIGCVAASAGSLMSWGAMGLFAPGW